MQHASYRIVPLQQNSVEWHEWRKLKIGASMAPTIMGENPYQTPLQLWEKIVKNIQTPDNQFMARGRELEPLAREWANEFLEGEYRPVCVESGAYPFIIASLDGYSDIDGEVRIIEIKCPSSSSFNPEMYKAQVQHQMMITSTRCCIMVIFEGKSGRCVRFDRDDDYIQKLLKAELDFYRRMMEFDPPEPLERDFIQIEDNEAEILSRQYLDACSKIKDLQEHKDRLRMSLIEKCSHDRCKIGNLKLTKFPKQGRVDYASIEILKTVNLDLYRKASTEEWRITGE